MDGVPHCNNYHNVTGNLKPKDETIYYHILYFPFSLAHALSLSLFLSLWLVN